MRDDRLTAGAMGSAFTPPNHPSQKWQVETDLSRKKENRGGMNIEYALEQDYVSEITKEKIRNILKEWEVNKLPVNDTSVQKWILDCKNHMGEALSTEYIRKYYPEFKNNLI